MSPFPLSVWRIGARYRSASLHGNPIGLVAKLRVFPLPWQLKSHAPFPAHNLMTRHNDTQCKKKELAGILDNCLTFAKISMKAFKIRYCERKAELQKAETAFFFLKKVQQVQLITGGMNA